MREDETLAVLGMLSFTLEVPDLAEGLRFYTDAGLVARVEGDVARCENCHNCTWPQRTSTSARTFRLCGSAAEVMGVSEGAFTPGQHSCHPGRMPHEVSGNKLREATRSPMGP